MSIPDKDHISRFCKHTQVEDGEISAAVFVLRPHESDLSVNWLEYLNCDSREDEISEVRKTLRFTLKPPAKIAVLNVGNVKENVKKQSPDRREIDIVHTPNDNNPSHSSIKGLKHNDMEIARIMLSSVIEEYPASV